MVAKEAKGDARSITFTGYSPSFVVTVPNGMETAKTPELLIICLDCSGKKLPTCYS